MTKPDKKRLIELSTKSVPRRYTRGSPADHNMRAREVKGASYDCIRFDNDLSTPVPNSGSFSGLCVKPTGLSLSRYALAMASSTWVEQRAHELFALHRLDSRWSFSFDHAKTRFGQCDHRRLRITLSRYLCNQGSDDDVEQVLLHEIAHALVGARAGHGALWLAQARNLGYRGGRTHSADPASEHANWLGLCPNGHEVLRFRKPSRAMSCAKCEKRFNPDHIITWSKRALRARP